MVSFLNSLKNQSLDNDDRISNSPSDMTDHHQVSLSLPLILILPLPLSCSLPLNGMDAIHLKSSVSQ